MRSDPAARRAEILLVEDNPGDVRLTREALKMAMVPSRLHVVTDGVEAMDFLRRRGLKGEFPRPDLILLDLNLPRKDGRDVLAEIKADPALGRIPVVVLTTSQADQDIQRAYELHANCYIAKPIELDQFIEIVASIKQFWLSTARLPAD